MTSHDTNGKRLYSYNVKKRFLTFIHTLRHLEIIFLIYVNDISSTLRMFADDTKVYRELSNIGRDTEALQLDVDELLSKWQLRFMLHSLCILQGAGGGADDFRERVLKFLEQKRGRYGNRLNISWGDAYFLYDSV